MIKKILILILALLIIPIVSAVTLTEDFSNTTNILKGRITDGKALADTIKSPITLTNTQSQIITTSYDEQLDYHKDGFIDKNDLIWPTNVLQKIQDKFGSSPEDTGYKLLYTSPYNLICSIQNVFCDFNHNEIVDQYDINSLDNLYSLYNQELFGNVFNEIKTFLNNVNVYGKTREQVAKSIYSMSYDLNKDNRIDQNDLDIINAKLNSLNSFLSSVENELYGYLKGGTRELTYNNIVYKTEQPLEDRCHNDWKLQIYDKTTGSPVLVKEFHINYEESGSITSMYINNDYLFVTLLNCGFGEGGFKIFDIKNNPVNPINIYNVNYPNLIGYPQKVYFDGGKIKIESTETDTPLNQGGAVNNIAPFPYKAIKKYVYEYILNPDRYEKNSVVESKTVYSENYVIKATLNAIENLNNQNIKYYLSNDDGRTWELVTKGTEHRFNKLGNNLKWKAELISDGLNTPEIDSLTIYITTAEGSKSLELSTTANVPTQIAVTEKVNLKITTNIALTGNITIAELSVNPETTLTGFKTPLGKYIVIDADEIIKNNLGQATITVKYTDSELTNLELNENTLQFFYYNPTTVSWEPVITTIDKDNNIINAIINHFSTFGISGDKITTTPTTPSTPSSRDNDEGDGGGEPSQPKIIIAAEEPKVIKEEAKTPKEETTPLTGAAVTVTEKPKLFYTTLVIAGIIVIILIFYLWFRR